MSFFIQMEFNSSEDALLSARALRTYEGLAMNGACASPATIMHGTAQQLFQSARVPFRFVHGRR